MPPTSRARQDSQALAQQPDQSNRDTPPRRASQLDPHMAPSAAQRSRRCCGAIAFADATDTRCPCKMMLPTPLATATCISQCTGQGHASTSLILDHKVLSVHLTMYRAGTCQYVPHTGP